MKVQKVIVEEKSYPLYILLDKEFEVIEPVKRFIKYLDNTGKAPNTIKTYCYHLKLFYEFMSQSTIELGDVFCNKKVQRIATKNTECCHPIFSLFSRQCVC